MSDYDKLYEDQADDSTLVKDLRKQLREAAKARDAFAAQVKEFETKSRAATLADLLKAKNLNPKVAALLPQDVEATEDGVNAWLKEYGDVFGVTAQEEKPAAQAEEETSNVSPGQAAINALARAQALGHDGTPPQAGTTATQAKLGEIFKSATSMEELTAALTAAASGSLTG